MPRKTNTDASMITPSMPPTTAATASRRRTPSTIAAKPIASAAPVNEPKSWWPRNETSRWPGRGPSGSSTIAKNISTPQPAAATAQATNTARKRSTSTCRRKSSTTAGASRAYSIDFAAVTRCLVGSSSGRQKDEMTNRASSEPARIQSQRPCRSGSQPNLNPAITAAATVNATAMSDP